MKHKGPIKAKDKEKSQILFFSMATLVDRLRWSKLNVQTNKSRLLLVTNSLVALLLRQAFVDSHHICTQYLRSILQHKYWTTRVRNALRGIKHQFFPRTNALAQPFTSEKADFPKQCLNDSKYFSKIVELIKLVLTALSFCGKPLNVGVVYSLVWLYKLFKSNWLTIWVLMHAWWR